MNWTKFRQRSRRISSLLALVPSLAYGGLYLLLIPCFAGIYEMLAADFYHSTVQFESSLHGEAESLLGELRQVSNENFWKVHREGIASVDGWTLAFSDVSFHSLKIEEQQISFTVSTTFKSEPIFDFKPDLIFKSGSISRHMEVVARPRVSIPLDFTYSMWQPGERQITDFKAVQFQQYTPMEIEGLKPPPLSALFPYHPEGVAPDLVVIAMPRSLSKKFVDFARATRGFPSGVRGGYPRMLYLSTVTITTLGYGDIVPLTPLARFLVALEATLGVVLVGLFLNALTHENSTFLGREWYSGRLTRGVETLRCRERWRGWLCDSQSGKSDDAPRKSRRPTSLDRAHAGVVIRRGRGRK